MKQEGAEKIDIHVKSFNRLFARLIQQRTNLLGMGKRNFLNENETKNTRPVLILFDRK